MKREPMVYLSARDVNRALPMCEAISVMKEAFRELSEGQVTLPVRQCVNVPDQDGVDLVMPCHSAALKLCSVKTVTVFSGNRNRELPTTQGLVVLTDGVTGSHLAILDGSSLTAIRTGAAAGLATDLMARSDASVIAVFGAGSQARTQLEAVCCVRPIKRARVYSLRQHSAKEFALEMTARLGIDVEVADSPSAATHDADVICTATSSSIPVFSERDVTAGTHINAIGAYRADMAEIPPEVVCRSRIVVDHRESAMEEAGDLLGPLRSGLISPDELRLELGELVAARSQFRTDREQVTLFKSVGVAIQDLYAAKTTLDNARSLGLGVTLS